MLTPKVVLVEDNTTIRETLVPALQELAGARVVAMADGAQEALATLRQVPWDVLVLDMFLREGTGLEVLAQLPGELAGRKVYVLTNYATADLREACARLGAGQGALAAFAFAHVVLQGQQGPPVGGGAVHGHHLLARCGGVALATHQPALCQRVEEVDILGVLQDHGVCGACDGPQQLGFHGELSLAAGARRN